MTADVRTRRIYEDPDPDDGHRVLIDRLWPRGISKERAQLDEWLREIAPSDELRQWYRHDPELWDEFQARYRAELDAVEDVVDGLVERARSGRLTLVFASKEEQLNNAAVLRQVVLDRLG